MLQLWLPTKALLASASTTAIRRLCYFLLSLLLSASTPFTFGRHHTLSRLSLISPSRHSIPQTNPFRSRQPLRARDSRSPTTPSLSTIQSTHRSLLTQL
ncbi:hypothetical protein B0H13DRAFT_2126213 [Mycena leptocephala]|nr:hypothetical protein B0H13DRAFT_2126213 [Mycena leptocephala]